MSESTNEMPALPEVRACTAGARRDCWLADQMHAYARDYAAPLQQKLEAAERERDEAHLRAAALFAAVTAAIGYKPDYQCSTELSWETLCKLWDVMHGDNTALQSLLAAAEQKGREEAAKVCDAQALEPECPERAAYCAEAIRALPTSPAPAPCQHSFHYFGDQAQRRCLHCNALEAAAPVVTSGNTSQWIEQDKDIRARRAASDTNPTHAICPACGVDRGKAVCPSQDLSKCGFTHYGHGSDVSSASDTKGGE